MSVRFALVREAFHASGEKHFVLSGMLYSILFGGDWAQAILGFAYLKCLDNLVDEDHSADRALAALVKQQVLIERVYSGRDAGDISRAPERFGFPFFVHDRETGGRLRPVIETILSTMEFDTRRRHRVLTAKMLDDYVVDLGTAVLRFLARFAAPDVELPRTYAELAARAYLYADTIIDLQHDLRFGVINVSEEDIAQHGLSLSAEDPRLRPWMTERAAVVLDLFDRALKQGRGLEKRTLRLLSQLYLSNKQRKLRRFLQREDLAPLSHAAAASGANGSA